MDVFALTLRLKEEGAASVKASVDKLRDSYTKGAKSAEDYSDATLGVSSAIKSMVAAVGSAAVFQKFINETITAQFEQAQLANAIKATAGEAKQSLDALNDHAAALQRLSLFGAGAINDAQARLLTYTNIVGEQFPRATQTVLDYSAAFNVDLVQAAEAVGKALNYPSVGMAALSKQGFILTDAQKALIKEFEETGRLAEAQTMIFEELESVTKGAALASRDTLGGALASLTNAFNDLFAMSKGTADMLTTFTNRLVFMVSALNNSTKAFFLVAGGIAAMTIGLGLLVFQAEIAVARLAIIASATMISNFIALARAIGLSAAAMELLGKAGPLRILGIAAAVAGGIAVFVGLNKALKDSADEFAAFQKQMEASTKSFADLGGDSEGAAAGAVPQLTAAVVDQVAALMRLVEIMPVTRVEAGILAREERQLQTALTNTNLTYDARLALMERLLAVQAAQAAMTVRLTAEERAQGMGALPSMGLTPGGSRAIPQIRPHHKNGKLVSGGTPTDMLATGFAALEGDAEKVQQRLTASLDATKMQLAEQMDAMRVATMIFAQDIANTLVDSLAAGIETAIATGSLGEGFKALTRTLLSGLGSALQSFGRTAIMASALMQRFMEAMASMNPFAALAAGIGMVALGSMLKGAAQRSFSGGAGSGTMGGGIGSLGVGGSSVTRTFGPTMSGGSGATVQAMTPMQVTIIGPNDPNAQRAIATLMDNAARRGLVQGAGVRTL